MKIKFLVLCVLSVSLNVFAVDVGEDQKSECIYAVQSGRSNTVATTTDSQGTQTQEPTTVSH